MVSLGFGGMQSSGYIPKKATTEKLEELSKEKHQKLWREGLVSEVAKHNLVSIADEDRGIIFDLFQCTYCNRRIYTGDERKIIALKEKYCKERSIQLAKQRGTFNPEYQEKFFGEAFSQKGSK